MEMILTGLHIFACIGLIIAVLLLQSGRGAGLQMFGGGGDSLINTPSGSSFMRKATGWLAATFAFTSLFLPIVSNRMRGSSVTDRELPPPIQAPSAAPTAPAAETSQSPASPSEASKTPAKTPAKKK